MHHYWIAAARVCHVLLRAEGDRQHVCLVRLVSVHLGAHLAVPEARLTTGITRDDGEVVRDGDRPHHSFPVHFRPPG